MVARTTTKFTVECKMVLCTLYMSVFVVSNDISWCQPCDCPKRKSAAATVKAEWSNGPAGMDPPSLGPTCL